MKTKSIQSLAVFFGAAVILSGVVLAGPGPRGPVPTQAQAHYDRDGKATPVATRTVKTSASDFKSTTRTYRPNHYVYDIQGHVSVDL